MKPIVRNAGIVAMVFLIAVIFVGCMKHPQVAKPLSSSPGGAKAETNKIVVARVNNTELFMDALIRMMNTLPDQGPGLPPESLEERKKRALDSIILLELAYQQAKEHGLVIAPLKIDLAVANFKENVGGEKEYAEYLNSRNITEVDIRSEVERSLSIIGIYAKEVMDRAPIPEEELRKEYEKEKQQLIQPEKVSVIDVYVHKNDERASREEGEKILSLIKADSAQDPWNLVLDGSFEVRRLALRRERDQELYDAARKLKPQEISGLINMPAGVHIIKLESYSPERLLSFEEAKPKIEQKLKGPALEKRTKEWEQELKKDAKIEIMETIANGQKSVSGQG
jgi:parvulin-like peptidyl-prolyl isomerase